MEIPIENYKMSMLSFIISAYYVPIKKITKTDIIK